MSTFHGSDITLYVDGKSVGVAHSLSAANWERPPVIEYAVPMKAGGTVSLGNVQADWFAMAPLFGLNIVASRVMFETRVPVRQHRKKRINAKWNKRYGIKWRITAINDRDGMQVGNTLYLHPNLYERLKKASEIK